MKILFTGDWHLGLRTHSRTFEGINTRDSEFRKVIQFIIDYAISNQIDYFVHCGDLFHRSNPTVNDISFAQEVFRQLGLKGIRSVIIDGNHDAPAGTWMVSPITLIENVVKVVEDAKEIVLTNSLSLALTPFPVPLQFWNDKEKITERRIVIGHTSLEGAVAGAECFLLSKYCHVEKPPDGHITICGHIHKPQMVRKEPWAGYPGSILQNDFGEIGETKGFIIYDAELNKMEFVRTPCNQLIKIDYTEIDKFNPSGKIIKVTGSTKTFIDTDQIIESLYSRGAVYVNLDIRNDEKISARDEAMLASMSVSSMFERFCEIEKPISRVIELGREIVKEI